MSSPAGKIDLPKDGPKEGPEEILKSKPVRDALSDISTLREEMSTLYHHGQFAAPERVLKLTAKIDALVRRLSA